MSVDTILGLIIVPVLFIILLVSAYFLEKRAKDKGYLLTGEKHSPQPSGRMMTYLGLFIMMMVTAIGCWGFFITSWPLIIIGAIFFVVVYMLGHFMHIWELVHFVEKVMEKDKDR
jgi:hypothetical protein